MSFSYINRLLCIIALLLTVACRDSELEQHDESPSHSSEPVEPDYEQLIDDFEIEAALHAVRADDGSFVEDDSAGKSDTVAWFRSHLHTLDLSIFEEDPEIEGILIMGARLRFDGSGGGSAVVSTRSVFDGRCTIDKDGEDITLSPSLLVRAIRERSRPIY